MTRVTVTITQEDALDRDRDAAASAIARAVPGATVRALDPVEIELAAPAPGGGVVTWSQDTPEPLSRFLYRDAEPSAPYPFEIEVPACLTATRPESP
jgi:hypothetical protein